MLHRFFVLFVKSDGSMLLCYVAKKQWKKNSYFYSIKKKIHKIFTILSLVDNFPKSWANQVPLLNIYCGTLPKDTLYFTIDKVDLGLFPKKNLS